MYKLAVILLLLVLSCTQSDPGSFINQTKYNPAILTLDQANKLSCLPLKCIQTNYPYHLVHVMNCNEDASEIQNLYPAFHGCYDWHSAVHGHWSLVKLLKKFPNLNNADTIRLILKQNLSEENILKELDYFKKEQHKHFERTYGWAWLLKLAEELHSWDDTLARQLENNLQPLSNHIAGMFVEFLPKLNYPVRVGEHNNTAFGLTFAWDYATAFSHDSLLQIISKKAREFYLNDKDCPLNWEPGAYDFLSPCLEEVDLMQRVLCEDTFRIWIKDFLPQLSNIDINLLTGKVSDRTDGKLVHLDGLNFSRAWVLYGLAEKYPEYRYLINLANEHVNYSLPNLTDDSYEGGHWLATFAIYALDNN